MSEQWLSAFQERMRLLRLHHTSHHLVHRLLQKPQFFLQVIDDFNLDLNVLHPQHIYSQLLHHSLIVVLALLQNCLLQLFYTLLHRFHLRRQVDHFFVYDLELSFELRFMLHNFAFQVAFNQGKVVCLLLNFLPLRLLRELLVGYVFENLNFAQVILL